MSKISNLIRVVRSKSLKYLLFRSSYELERKSGLLARKFPTNPKKVRLPSLEWFQDSGFRFQVSGLTNVESATPRQSSSELGSAHGSNADFKFQVPKKQSEVLKADTERILRGEVRFFSDQWYDLGLDYDWVTNPLTGYRYDARQHWTKINDYSKEAGDIKFTWEASRFSWLYTIVRNDYHNEEDHSEFVVGRILDWIEKNPLNCGPNYKCSQETSLRVLNWLFALNFYKESKTLTEDRWQKIVTSIYWQIHHVYSNINFSRIAVRNNHAITETLTLYLTGLLFPDFPGAGKWKRNGKRWFEEEIAYQFEPDGSYIQNSMNYQRVVTQLLTLGIALAHKKGERFSRVVYDRAYANVNFLYQMQDERTGMLPNYGSNDGALFFQLSSGDYCDYRPQLDALYYVLTGKSLYGERFEDASWYGVTVGMEYPDIRRNHGITEFKNGGYFMVHDSWLRDQGREETQTTEMLFVRCGTYKGKCTPDLLHLDLWKDGENLLMDAGSYLYNTDEATLRYFSGTEGHNTVMLDGYDQMRKGMRFVWTNPSDIVSVKTSESDEEYVIEMHIKSFKYVESGFDVKRTVRKRKGASEIQVTDEVAPNTGRVIRQLWHTVTPEKLEFASDGKREEKEGAYSRYYGRKEPARQIAFATKECKITTTIKF